MSVPMFNMAARGLELDVGRMDFDENGLRDFYWPLARSEQQAQRDATLANLVAMLRGKLAAEDEDARLLSMCLHWYVNEAQLYFRATALQRRCQDAGVSLRWQPGARLLPAVANRTLAPVEDGRYVAMLKAGPASHPGLAAGLVKLRRSLDWNGIAWKAWRPMDMGRDIIAAYRCPLLDERARQSARAVKQTNLQDWFSRPNGRAILPGVAGDLADRAIQAVAEGYRVGGEALPDYQADYFRRFLDVVPGLIRTHYAPMAKRPRLPATLWTGSGGYIYNRMLRNAVRARGGHVTGHEHGSGDAHLAYFSAKPFIEYESADAFVTYSTPGAEALRSNFDASMHLRGEPPEILAHAEAPPPGDSRTPRLSGAGPIRSLMYPTTKLMGERVALDHIFGDNVMVDWSIRLMARMRGMGYRIIHKPHPEEEGRVSRRLAECLRIEQSWEPFERVYQQTDALLLDYSRTSIFSRALASDLPLVYIDFGFERWHPAAYELLQRRVGLVRGWIDADNRLNVDWDALPAAIAAAPDRMDKEIVRRYYPHLATGSAA